MANRIKIDELRSVLNKLQDGKTEYKFIGITSDGKDCIYILCEKGKFNLEFEAMTEEQISVIDKLKDFAELNGYNSKMTTYNNLPKYSSKCPAPVIRLETNLPLEEMVKLGENIQTEIFGNSKETVYTVVP